jgi:hypothetical protein
MPKITELYAYVVADTGEDDEGVPAFMGPEMAWMPLMGADRERAESLRPFAAQMAKQLGKPIKLIRSTGIEVVEVVEP